MYAYDVEILPNFFSVIFVKIEDSNIDKYIEADIDGNKELMLDCLKEIEHHKFIIFYDIFQNNKLNRNDVSKLRAFLTDIKADTLIGYNNKNYDDYILAFIEGNRDMYTVQELTSELYKLSQEIIHYDGYNFMKDSDYKFARFHRSIDLMRLNYLDKLRISLKQVSIALKWHRVEDYTMPLAEKADMKPYWELYGSAITVDTVNGFKSFERFVKYEYIDDIIEYNINDVLITNKLFIYSKRELNERINVYNDYKVYVLSDSRSTTADKLLSKLYSDYTGLKYQEYSNTKTFRRVINIRDLIASNVSFKSKELNSFLGTLSSIKIRVGEDKLEEVLLFNNVGYTFMLGGLHSIDKGGKFISSDDTKYIEFDVR